MFMGMIIAIYQFYCVQGRVAIPVNESYYYTIVVRQEKVIPIAKITNCMYTSFPTIVLCFTYKCPEKITGIEEKLAPAILSAFDTYHSFHQIRIC